MPKQLVQQVVNNEVSASQNDHTRWMYKDVDNTPTKDVTKLVVETEGGTASKIIRLNGLPPTPLIRQQDEAKMQSLLTDPAVLQKQRKDGAHDDKQATDLLKMLPAAFIWTYAGESNGEIHLRFRPNPAFTPPTYASRVFAAMAGEMNVDAKQKRLKLLSGVLTRSVEFGFGLFGKLEKGGTFRIVRTEVAPGEWQITQTHVHIVGHALFFKSIGQEQDETTSDYKHTPAGTTLKQAIERLNNGQIAEDLGLSRAAKNGPSS